MIIKDANKRAGIGEIAEVFKALRDKNRITPGLIDINVQATSSQQFQVAGLEQYTIGGFTEDTIPKSAEDISPVNIILQYKSNKEAAELDKAYLTQILPEGMIVLGEARSTNPKVHEMYLTCSHFLYQMKLESCMVDTRL